MARKKKRIPIATLNDTRLEVWEERDRLHINLVWGVGKKNGDTIAEWWDDDARQMFEDGFFDGRNLHQSVFDYAMSVELINPPGYE